MSGKTPEGTSKGMDPPSKKHSRQEFVRAPSLRLPTPPPDPTTSQGDLFEQAHILNKETLEKESEFLEYLNSLPTPSREGENLQRSTSVFAPAMAAEDAFDHLDKLYKVMEQLLNLRYQNSKLQRRIRDLEHSRTLQNMHREVACAVLRGEDTELPEINEDYILAEAFLDNILSKKINKSKPRQFKITRNFSVVSEEAMKPDEDLIITRKSLDSSIKKSAKVSKWTKVKAAFKWEKASPTVSGAKSQDSGIGGMLPVNNELARYLRVPSSSDANEGVSPADSVLSGSWQGTHGLSTPGTISPASSTDDLHPSFHSEHRSVSRTGSAETSTHTKRYRTSDDDDGERRSRSLDYTSSLLQYESGHPTKDDLHKFHHAKHHKTPWGKVKDIIQIRKDSLRKKQYRLSAKSDDTRAEWSAGSDQEDSVFLDITPDTKELQEHTPTVTITNTEELDHHDSKSKKSSREEGSSRDFLDKFHVESEDDKYQVKMDSSSQKVDRVSKWTKVKKAFLTSGSKSTSDDIQSVPASPTNRHCNFFIDISQMNTEDQAGSRLPPSRKISEEDTRSKKLQEEVYRNYEQLQKKLSLEFQEKLQEWEKVKASCASSTQNSSNLPSPNEEQSTDFAKKMEEWEKLKNDNKNTDSMKKKTQIQQPSGENLPADFKKKLQEWEKIKKGVKEPQHDSSSSKKKIDWSPWKTTSPKPELQLGQPDSRQLSDDFLKKLEEWKQIKANRDLERSNNDHQEHRKTSVKENKSPSPGLGRKDSTGKILRQSKKFKAQEDKELQWLEKELQKIDREKQRLEREREKFLEREERLAKLRRSVGTQNVNHKKDVLVQTSTGFYRFEGISKEFTRRLYEWEKARGIKPEESTIALLNTDFHNPNLGQTSDKNEISSTETQKAPIPRIKLHRSKSVDSVHVPFSSTLTQQPSSLSLNDMEELEVQCFASSRSPSPEDHPEEPEDTVEAPDYLPQIELECEDNLDEPEAVIVEVEDLEVETASPLEERVEGLKAVCSTETTSLCESEKCEAPQIRRSESARAMSSYNLIQETIVFLNKIIAAERSFKKQTDAKIDPTNLEKNTEKSTGAIPKRNRNFDSKNTIKDSAENHFNKQRDCGRRLYNKCILLQEANTSVVKNLSSENYGYTVTHVSDTVDILQDLSAEIVSSAEKLSTSLAKRAEGNEATVENKKSQVEVTELAESLISKIMELRRSLTYVCAASDMTAPSKKKKPSFKDRKHLYHRSLSSEAAVEKADTTDEEIDKTKETKTLTKRTSLKRKNKLVKSKSEDNSHYPERKIIDYKKEKLERSKTIFLEEPNQKNEEEQITNKENKTQKEIMVELHKKREQRKLLRTKRISDPKESKDAKEIAQIESTNNVVVPTSTHFLDGTVSSTVPTSPVSVFVHTTRKLFTPFVSEAFESRKEQSPKKEESLPEPEGQDSKISTKVSIETSEFNPTTHLPPLPNSPVAQRRERLLSKETSPAIRIMIARYNQKLSEQENPGYKSGGSSGSNSPVAWRSPVLERRVKTQTEKYQKEVNKANVTITSQYSPLFARKQVQKSASVGVMNLGRKQITIPQQVPEKLEGKGSPKLIRGILKSSSVDAIKRNHPQNLFTPIEPKDNIPESLPIVEPLAKPLQDRAYKLQKAKEQFFSSITPVPSTSSSSKEEPPLPIVRNRLSQVSFGSESSFDDSTCSGLLIKSASAGMINIEEEVFQQFLRPEVHTQGYVSLPRSTTFKKKEDRFGISSITSKFRKVKLRNRNRISSELNAVSTLCRQSLVVDISDHSGTSENSGKSDKKSEKQNWLKNKIFKPK